MMNVRKAIDVLKLTTRHDVFLDVYTIEGRDSESCREVDDKVIRKFANCVSKS